MLPCVCCLTDDDETRHLSQTMLLLISIFIIEHNNQIKCIRARHVVGLPGHEGLCATFVLSSPHTTKKSEELRLFIEELWGV